VLCRRSFLVPLALVVVWSIQSPTADARPRRPAPADVIYRPPVDAPVVDPYRPPPDPYSAGNRGLEYGTAPGTPVRAAADGTVVFAGQVAGSLHITVRHTDGIRTSYSFLADLRVGVGAQVLLGDELGSTVGHLHFGARVGEVYVDPALLFTSGAPVIRLVPDEQGSDGGSLLGEQRALSDFVQSLIPPQPSVLMAPSSSSLLLWPTGQHIPPLLHYAVELRPDVRSGRIVAGLHDWREARGDCTPADVFPSRPPGRRIALLVGGLGTTSEGASVDGIDPHGLGYAADDIVRFSYAGGRVPSEIGGPLAAIDATTYTKPDTEGDLLVAGERLRALLAEIAAAEPGVPIDIIAHSQGGVVARAALLEPVGLPTELDNLVTLASPHGGSDLATGIALVREAPLGREGVALVEAWRHTGLNPDGVSAGQLAETSDFIVRLEASGPPAGVEFRSIGARGDLVVAATHTDPPGGRHITLPLAGSTAHTRVASDPLAQREVALAVAGQAPTCESATDVALDLTYAEAVSWGEDALALASFDLTGG
jgi:hypothetical protein